MSVLVSIVSVLATLSFLALVLGPAPDIRRIHQTHSTGVTPITPLVSLFTSAWIWTIYAYFAENFFPLFVDNVISLLLGLCYTAIYYKYSTERAYAHKIFACFGFVIVASTIYAIVGGLGFTNQSRESVKNVFGYLGNAAVFVFFVSPFENISKVFKYKSGVFIPIVVVAAGAVNSVLWILYSLLTTDWLLFLPNAIALTIGSVQIALYFFFHPSKHPIDTTDLEGGNAPARLVRTQLSAVSINAVDFGPINSPVEAHA